MRTQRSYYSAKNSLFLQQSTIEILGIIHANVISSETTIQQNNAWNEEIYILKDQLSGVNDGRVIIEYTIPRMGKRVDAIILLRNIIFLLEFKCGDTEYRSSTYDQVYDYALDLRNFHKESHDKLLVPIIVSTKAPSVENILSEHEGILKPLLCNKDNIKYTLKIVCDRYSRNNFDYAQWENSEYFLIP